MTWEAIIQNRNSESFKLDDILIDAEKKKWPTENGLGPNTGGMDHLMALETVGKKWEYKPGGSLLKEVLFSYCSNS